VVDVGDSDGGEMAVRDVRECTSQGSDEKAFLVVLDKGLHGDVRAFCGRFVVAIGAKGLIVGLSGVRVAKVWGAVAVEAGEVLEDGIGDLALELGEDARSVTVCPDVCAADVSDDSGYVEVVVDDAGGNHPDALWFDGCFVLPCVGRFAEGPEVDVGVVAYELVEMASV